MTQALKKSRLCKFILVFALIFILAGLVSFLDVWASPVTEELPQFKFKARITGDVCEIWGTNPNKQEGDWVTMLAVVDCLPSDITSGSDIAYIDQFETGKNGSFLMTFKLLTDRIAHGKKIYIVMNSAGCSISDFMEVPIYPVTGDKSEIPTNSLKVGLDVYEMASELLTEDNLVDSIRLGGNEIYFKLGDNWYDLLDDKCVSSEWLVSSNALDTTDVDKMVWAKYYKAGEYSPVYFE